ncbi:SGNH/GDSL hydrolase family protein [Streptomyces cinnamoneus]|uniref:SGNH/GDSL hydrolase family protein n=1 Tax=Streptomyces cinnamoneus TaxID=53446 RepID=UPI00378F3299
MPRAASTSDDHTGNPEHATRATDAAGPRYTRALRKWPAALTGCALLATSLTAVTAPAHAAGTGGHGAGKGTAYVALGDSYAAGAGIPATSAGLCLRSDHNYGHLVAAAIKPASYTDATCGAAKVSALTRTQTDAGIPVNGPQLDAVKPDTDLVTLTIGGNDIGTSDLGFVEVVAACTALALTNPFGSPCQDAYKDKLVRRLDAAAPAIADALRTIHAKAPGARVLVVGYPAVVPDDPKTCVGKVPVTVGDTAYLRSVLGRLNDMLAATAAAHHATYVDTFTATKGHDPCSANPWVEGFIPGKVTLPLHPNATGERVRADAVLRALRG